MSERLLFEIKDRIGTITLNRPEKLNAFTDEMLENWIEALEECRTSDAVNVVVVTGTGRAFTAGGDRGPFEERATASASAIKARLERNVQRLPRKFDEIDKPIIAAVNGLALGAGMDVTLMCDLRFAAESARFAEVYALHGLIPGAGGAYHLPRLIGRARALEMFWTCDSIDAKTAADIGLVNRVFPDDELMARTYEFAQRLADGPQLALRLIKRAVQQGLDTDLSRSLDFVASNMPIVRSSEDHREAILAAKEKRKPAFKGR